MKKCKKTIEMVYKNYRGETSKRVITPLSMRFGETSWHTEKCWLLKAFDHDKQDVREFALSDTTFKDLSLGE